MQSALLEFNLTELQAIVVAENAPVYRAKQLYKWLQLGKSYDDMSDIPKTLRESLAAKYNAQPITILKQFDSKDGTAKFLFGLSDGNTIEGVYMKYKYGNTLCISSQVGCRMGCAFCASGLEGLIRNLTAGEILGQVVAVNALMGGTIEKRAVTNVVLMGSGEPLDNYDNVTKFVLLVSGEDGLNISRRNISLSTCGLADNIRRLVDDGYNITLTISLHATTDSLRAKLIPMANKFSVDEIMSAARYYFEKTGRRVIFEYILIAGVNHSKEDACRLKVLLKNMSAHVNLIMLNHVEEKSIKGASRAQAEEFLKNLEKNGVSATIRRSMGADIEGACGQLRRKFVGGKQP